METFIVEKWNDFLNAFEDDKVDIYYFEEYVKLYETDTSKALCAVCKDGEKVLLMPYMCQEVGEYFDFETVYGYGGPISNVVDIRWIEQALIQMQKMFADKKYICGFVRFHTLIGNAIKCQGNMQIIFDRPTVVIDTTMSEDEIWAKQITSKNRNMIRKAEKNGLVYKAEYDFASIGEFISLYNSTMQRLNADDFYFFDDSYYESFIRALTGKAFIGTVRYNGLLICAALFMFSKNYGHYHLEGSNYDYSKMAANNLLLWKTACEFHRLGVKQFHLGGGYNSDPDNSLLRFKKAFGNELKDFYIGKWIFDNDKYYELKNKWKANNPEKVEKLGKLLLCYRY